MSTEKVNKYKENKRRRQETARKEKRARILHAVVCVAVLAAVGLWCMYLGRGVYAHSHVGNNGNSTNSVLSTSGAVVTDSAGNTYSLVQTSSGGYGLQPNAGFADGSSGVNTSISSTEENQK